MVRDGKFLEICFLTLRNLNFRSSDCYCVCVCHMKNISAKDDEQDVQTDER